MSESVLRGFLAHPPSDLIGGRFLALRPSAVAGSSELVASHDPAHPAIESCLIQWFPILLCDNI